MCSTASRSKRRSAFWHLYAPVSVEVGSADAGEVAAVDRDRLQPVTQRSQECAERRGGGVHLPALDARNLRLVDARGRRQLLLGEMMGRPQVADFLGQREVAAEGRQFGDRLGPLGAGIFLDLPNEILKLGGRQRCSYVSLET
jgi:hypothetical protein